MKRRSFVKTISAAAALAMIPAGIQELGKAENKYHGDHMVIEVHGEHNYIRNELIVFVGGQRFLIVDRTDIWFKAVSISPVAAGEKVDVTLHASMGTSYREM